jgi:hypothetical protein
MYKKIKKSYINNMKTSILRFEVIMTIFVIIAGILLHFSYEWSNENQIVGIFSAVNESTWEHLKLIFFPMLVTIVIGTIYYKDDYENYLCTKTKGLLISLVSVIVLFYTYSGVLGKNISAINIGIYIISILISLIYNYNKLNDISTCNNKLSIVVLITLLISFITFTFYTPKIDIFEDPITNTYGINQN